MNLRLAIASCAVIAWTSNVSLCQPPTPRVANGEGTVRAVVALAHMMLKDRLTAFDRVEQAVQTNNLSGLRSLDSMRDRSFN